MVKNMSNKWVNFVLYCVILFFWKQNPEVDLHFGKLNSNIPFICKVTRLQFILAHSIWCSIFWKLIIIIVWNETMKINLFWRRLKSFLKRTMNQKNCISELFDRKHLGIFRKDAAKWAIWDLLTYFYEKCL